MPSTLCEVPGQPAHGFLFVLYVELRLPEDICHCRWGKGVRWGGGLELRGSESAWDASGV